MYLLVEWCLIIVCALIRCPIRYIGKVRGGIPLLKVKSILVFVFQTTLAFGVLTATPALSGVLCGKGHTVGSEQTVVAHLNESAGEKKIIAPSRETGKHAGAVSHDAPVPPTK